MLCNLKYAKICEKEQKNVDSRAHNDEMHKERGPNVKNEQKGF